MFGLILILGASLVPPLTSLAHADEPSNWTYALSARSRYEQGSRYNLHDSKDFSTIRLRGLVTYTGIERFKIVAEPQYNKVWGAEPFVGSTTALNQAQATSGSTTYPGTYDEINLRSAYLDFTVMPGLNAMIGRQILLYGDQQILGPADWGPYSRSFDAVRVRYQWRELVVDGLHAKIVDTQTSQPGYGSDKNLDGFYATWSPAASVKQLEAYHFWVRDNEHLNDPKDKTRAWMFGTFGTRIVASFGALAAKLEYAKNFGPPEIGTLEDDKYNGMLTTRADYEFPALFTQKVGLEFFHAGENWRELYPTPFEAMGRTDVLGRRNIVGGAVHWLGSRGDQWNVGVDGLYFRRVGDSTTVFQPDGRTAIGLTDLTTMEVGYEVDLTARYNLTKQISFSGGFSILFPSAYLNDSVTDDLEPPTYVYAMLELRQ